jgi:hypothetical protein
MQAVRVKDRLDVQVEILPPESATHLLIQYFSQRYLFSDRNKRSVTNGGLLNKQQAIDMIWKSFIHLFSALLGMTFNMQNLNEFPMPPGVSRLFRQP